MKNQDIEISKSDCGEFCIDYFIENGNPQQPLCCYYGKGYASYNGMTVNFEGCSIPNAPETVYMDASYFEEQGASMNGFGAWIISADQMNED